MPGTDCMPGEEIFAIFLLHRGRAYQLRLSLSLLILLDYLARSSRSAQTAAQIECGVRKDDFYTEHAANAAGRRKLVRRIPRSAVRELVRRLHRAFGLAFRDAGLRLDPRSVLLVQPTVSNQVLYRLRASVQWVHIDSVSADVQPLWE